MQEPTTPERREAPDNTGQLKRKKKRVRRRYRRARILLTLLMLVAASSVLIYMHDDQAPADFDNAAMKEIGDPDAPVPKIGADGAEVYCTNLEQPVYQKNANKKIDPYSITKILTGYLAVENLDLDKVVTISEHAATPLENGTTIYLQAGEKISVRDLLYGAMLESGNDAATALAEAVSGSEEKFAELMNKQAKEWGCENTHFVNANGWKNDDHYTTAHDMALITARSFENEDLRKITMTEEYVIPPTNMSEARTLVSHTLRGRKVDYMVGGKTGGWTSKDASLAVAFSKNGIDGSAVVLRTKSKNRKKEINKLIGVVQDITPGYMVTEKGGEVCQARVKGGKKFMTTLCADNTITAYPKGYERSGIQVKLKRADLEAPLKAGTEAGTYTVYVDGKKLKSGTLMTTEDIGKGSFLANYFLPDRAARLIGGILLAWLALMIILIIAEVRARKQRI